MVGEQVAVPAPRVATTVSCSTISFPLPESSRVTMAVHWILTVLVMLALTVMHCG